MTYSFHAYIDEAGDDGFAFRSWPDRGSSEWFVVSACVVKASRHAEGSSMLHTAIAPLEVTRNAPIHFTKLNHEQRVGVVHAIGRTPMRTITVCFNKPGLPPDHTLAGNRRLYFYAVRYLLERVSWLARDNSALEHGDGRCKLHFSKCKGLSYASLVEYLSLLRQQRTQIAWNHIDAESVNIAAPATSIWLRATDCVASGFYKALELSPQGYCEDRYAKILRPVVYKYGKRALSYGIKITPFTPAVEPERDNRYEWLSLYR